MRSLIFSNGPNTLFLYALSARRLVVRGVPPCPQLFHGGCAPGFWWSTWDK